MPDPLSGASSSGGAHTQGTNHTQTTGTLDGRDVHVDVPGAQRTAPPPAGDGSEKPGFFARMFSWSSSGTSNSVRAETAVRNAQTSVANSLKSIREKVHAAVPKESVDAGVTAQGKQALRQFESELQNAATPVISASMSLAQVMKAPIATYLNSLTLPAAESLMRQMDLLSADDLVPDSVLHLFKQSLNSHVTDTKAAIESQKVAMEKIRGDYESQLITGVRQQMGMILEGAVRAANNSAERRKGEMATNTLCTLQQVVRESLRTADMKLLQVSDVEQYIDQVVASTIARSIERGALTSDGVEAWLTQVSTSDKSCARMLANMDRTIAGTSCAAVRPVIARALDTQFESTTRAANEALQAGSSANVNINGFVDHMTLAGEQYGDIKSKSTGFLDQTRRDRHAPCLTALKSALGSLTAGDFKGLSDAQIADLFKAAHAMGIELPTEMQTELDARRDASRLAFQAAYDTVLGHLTGGNLKDGVASLAGLNDLSSHYANFFASSDQGAIKALRDGLVNPCFGKLDDASLQTVGELVRSNQGNLLFDELGEEARRIDEEIGPEQAAPYYQLYSNLQDVRDKLEDAAELRAGFKFEKRLDMPQVVVSVQDVFA
ncbi:hypothetical protein SDC9_79918 [bioreactor metagenome]|uniref:Uncharacterized protein n=1 Tax=bioreactor metagenome TaxID=1076179 RepID=A0A644YXM3_9ZZZZ